MKSLVSYWTPCQTIVNVLQTIGQIWRFIIRMYFKPCLPTNKLHDACIFRYTSATTLSSKVSSFTVQSCCVVAQHLPPTTVASREVEDELEVDANREGTKEAPALSAETG